MNITQSYSKNFLAPRLKKYGLNKEQREVICSDVEQRLASILSHWKDEPFRRTLLTLGNEEAAFWEPANTSLDIRSLVVLGVRNSLVEDLNATTRSRRPVLPDEEMPALTAEAIEYFQAADLQGASLNADPDLFGALPRRFPNAWQCLSALPLADAVEATYTLRKEKAESLEFESSRRQPAIRTTVIASGIDASFDSELRKLMSMIQRGELPLFIAPSFSRITRNPAKLLSILDHVLRHDATLVTSNYMLSGTYVARRHPLIRPAHSATDYDKNQENHEGLSAQHKELLSLG
jgi:hypothetical protein